MLKTLRISNYALIDQLDIDFSEGLNVLTGETGAGKSIVVGAISLLIGGRSQAEYIRDKSKKTWVEGYFDLDVTESLRELFVSLGIEYTDEYLVLRREINPNGKSTARINGVTIPVSQLKEIASYMINIYGQHDFQILSNPSNHLKILDAVGKQEIKKEKKAVYQAYGVLEIARQEKQEIENKRNDAQQRKEFLSFQLQEIEAADIEDKHEDEEIDRELSILENYEKISRTVHEVSEALYGQQSAYGKVGMALSSIQELKNYIDKAKEIEERLQQVYYEIEDVVLELKQYTDTTNANPNRLDHLNERKFELQKLKNKHRLSLSELIEKRETIRQELDVFENLDFHYDKAVKKFGEMTALYQEAANTLHEKRKIVAVDLEKKIAKELSYMGMKDTVFKTIFSKTEPGKEGTDAIEFLVSANIGEEPKPIAKIASGGEMSRIMLSLKVIMTDDGISTMIFDEIDSGIGGETVVKVSKKLKEVAIHKQVLCVTHSPHVASQADGHFLIEKVQQNQRTQTGLRRLLGSEKVDEISRMLGDTGIDGKDFAKKMIEADR